jgi:hypothetical protein
MEYTTTIQGFVNYSVDRQVVLDHFGVADLADIDFVALREFLNTCVQEYVDDDRTDQVEQYLESGDTFNQVIREDVYRSDPAVTLDLATAEYSI